MGSIGGLFLPSKGQGTLPVARQSMLSSIRLVLKHHAVNLTPSYSAAVLWPYVAGGGNYMNNKPKKPSTLVVGVGWDRMRMGWSGWSGVRWVGMGGVK